MSKDYYQILGVSKDASQDEIKKSFRKLAHQHHPDKKSGDEAKFKDINEAYQVLSNSEKRKKYDQFGSSFEQMGGWGQHSWDDVMQGFRQGFSSEDPFEGVSFDFGGGLGDIFRDFFGGSGFSRSAGQRSHSGSDIQVQIKISFLEAVFGTEREFSLDKNDKCQHCKGNGAEPNSKIETCKTCGGSGQIRQARSSFLGVIQIASSCPECQGQGSRTSQTCSKCYGPGYARARKKIKIKIPAGISDGETIRLAGQGEPGEQGGAYGDLYVVVFVESDSRFNRQADDIITQKEISFPQAGLGDKVEIQTVDGKVMLKIPSGTQTGRVFKLRGKGVPHLRHSGRGDHLVEVVVKTPERLSRKAKKLMEQLAKEI